MLEGILFTLIVLSVGFTLLIASALLKRIAKLDREVHDIYMYITSEMPEVVVKVENNHEECDHGEETSEKKTIH